MGKFKNINPTIIVIFGGTGDLAKRKLFPAFQNLYLDGRMSKKFQIIALGRAEKSDEEFRSYVLENLNAFSRKKGLSDPETEKMSGDSSSPGCKPAIGSHLPIMASRQRRRFF